ncbi:probable transcription repressor [Lentisphaera araneosa HTCC2155]|uniref:Probable transcription repressor n=1 Tax=Lentisphaera araneosa HTCC2155 TaxID=313628 RepID=A6DFD9_9BACT|nr:ROK family protein [Lentisphaera araneosa]EDM29519.1 probable transcription repressor [Lentisphaera araneosa HTCC2155]
MKKILGFDLGGTKVLAAVLDNDFNILSRVKMKANADLGVKSVYKVICAVIKDACDEAGIDVSDLSAIGGCAPGLVEPKTGLVYDTPNLGFKNFPLQEKLSQDFNIPVHIENDVNAGLYGELHFGAARGMENVLALSPGTGVGGAIVIDGKLIRGSRGGAGEFGHIIVQPDGPLCGCGQRGCLEAISSRTALSQQILSFAVRGRVPLVIDEAKGNLKKVKSGLIARAYNSGDEDVQAIVDYAARYLGVGMSNLVNSFNPEAIILGGGLIEALPEPFLKISTKVMREKAMGVNGEKVKVLAAELGDDAVIKGSAQLAAELVR